MIFSSDYFPYNDSINIYELGKKTKRAQRKASKAGAEANRGKAIQLWMPLLNSALETATSMPQHYSAASLAKIILRKHQSNGKLETFSRKILGSPGIKPLLKKQQKKPL